MTERRIVSSILMSAALVLGVVGCPPVDPNDNDAGATGGTAPVPVCDRVTSLPTQGSACSTMRESLCDSSGNQCVCDRGIWYCNTRCASSYPTEPAPHSACIRGSACTYPSGVSCTCASEKWMCTGGSRCPVAAPTTGELCTGLTNLVCDYPADPTIPYPWACECLSSADMTMPGEPVVDAGDVSTWSCVLPTPCPATQPTYSLAATCPGYSLCHYGSTLCSCQQPSWPWCCGTGCFFPIPIQI